VQKCVLSGRAMLVRVCTCIVCVCVCVVCVCTCVCVCVRITEKKRRITNNIKDEKKNLKEQKKVEDAAGGKTFRGIFI